MNQVVFISGQVTGLHPQVATELFTLAETALQAEGYAVRNPLTLYPSGAERSVTEQEIRNCDTVYMLENWRYCEEAVWVHAVARRLSKKIIYQQAVSSLQYKTMMREPLWRITYARLMAS